MNKFNVTKIAFGLLSAGLLATSFSSQAAVLDTQVVDVRFDVQSASTLAVSYQPGAKINPGKLPIWSDLGIIKVNANAGDKLVFVPQHVENQNMAIVNSNTGKKHPVAFAKVGSFDPVAGEYVVQKAALGGFSNADLYLVSMAEQDYDVGQYSGSFTVRLETL
ncbi:MAG: hypothetical protein ACRC5D_05180 [Aeromonas allosaccharophila]